MLAEEPCDERHNYLTLDHKNWVDYLPFLGETKMEGILMTVFGTGISTLAFVRTNYAFGKDGCGDYEAEGKPRDLAEEKNFKKSEINRNKMLHQKTKQKHTSTFLHVNEEMLEYYRVFSR